MRDLQILLADDHALFRAGLRSLLATLGGFAVAGEASDGLEVLEFLRHNRPDIVLLDLMMPGLNGLETTKLISREFTDVPVIILSMNSAEEFVVPSLRAGARGYLLKNVAPDELANALRTVAEGNSYITASVRTRRFEFRPDTGAVPHRDLTSRQREVLQLVAEGFSTKAISARLGLAVKTVESHRTQLMAVLGIHDIAGLTRYAIRHGIVSLEL